MNQKKFIYYLISMLCIITSLACSQGKINSDIKSDLSTSTNFEISSLLEKISRLRSNFFGAQFSIGSNDDGDRDDQNIINRKFDTMNDFLRKMEHIPLASMSIEYHIENLSYLSISNCPLNTGRCPLAVIKRNLGQEQNSLETDIADIDNQLDHIIQKLIQQTNTTESDLGFHLTNNSTEDTKLPTSGSEPAYEPQRWNDNGNVQNNTNCYAYSQNLQKSPINGLKFPFRKDGFALQPGDFAGKPLPSEALREKSGLKIIELVKLDASKIGGVFEWSNQREKLPNGFYKVALVLSPDGDEPDYHWYRQNPDGTWSHKPGQLSVRNVDAENRIIFDPQTANRASGMLNYRYFIGYFKVKARAL